MTKLYPEVINQLEKNREIMLESNREIMLEKNREMMYDEILKVEPNKNLWATPINRTRLDLLIHRTSLLEMYKNLQVYKFCGKWTVPCTNPSNSFKRLLNNASAARRNIIDAKDDSYLKKMQRYIERAGRMQEVVAELRGSRIGGDYHYCKTKVDKYVKHNSDDPSIKEWDKSNRSPLYKTIKRVEWALTPTAIAGSSIKRLISPTQDKVQKNIIENLGTLFSAAIMAYGVTLPAGITTLSDFDPAILDNHSLSKLHNLRNDTIGLIKDIPGIDGNNVYSAIVHTSAYLLATSLLSATTSSIKLGIDLQFDITGCHNEFVHKHFYQPLDLKKHEACTCTELTKPISDAIMNNGFNTALGLNPFSNMINFFVNTEDLLKSMKSIFNQIKNIVPDLYSISQGDVKLYIKLLLRKYDESISLSIQYLSEKTWHSILDNVHTSYTDKKLGKLYGSLQPDNTCTHDQYPCPNALLIAANIIGHGHLLRGVRGAVAVALANRSSAIERLKAGLRFNLQENSKNNLEKIMGFFANRSASMDWCKR